MPNAMVAQVRTHLTRYVPAMVSSLLPEKVSASLAASPPHHYCDCCRINSALVLYSIIHTRLLLRYSKLNLVAEQA